MQRAQATRGAQLQAACRTMRDYPSAVLSGCLAAQMVEGGGHTGACNRCIRRACAVEAEARECADGALGQGERGA